jgi:phosphopantothenate-cysteine ligase
VPEGGALDGSRLFRMAADGTAAPFVDAVRASVASAADRLLVLEFQTVFDYVTLLRASALAVRPLAARALVVLAAAVSDFYLPLAQMSTHKIQSRAVRARARGGARVGRALCGGRGAGAGSCRAHTYARARCRVRLLTASRRPRARAPVPRLRAPAPQGGGLALQLVKVPKLLGALKHAETREGAWAPDAVLVSFKLETNACILAAKAAGALAKYGVDLVVANQLQTYRRRVTLVAADEEVRAGRAQIRVHADAIHGDEAADVAVDGLATRTLDAADGGKLEAALAAELVKLHALRLSSA